ncbi:MAG: helix-turn-helix transcriptional regulator [Clostridiales bacterium]|nr:helix-turn-helix transcriptional regulator [Clostridiales bacterium]
MDKFILAEQSNVKCKSAISIHNQGNAFSELYELADPYLLIYQSNYVSTQTLFMLGPSSCFVSTYLLGDYIKRVPHKHNYFEIMIVLSGQVTQVIENTEIVYKAGDACILNKNIRHFERFDSIFEVVYIELSDKLLDQILVEGMPSLHKKEYETALEPFCHLKRLNEKKKYYDAKEYIDFHPITKDGKENSLDILLPFLNDLAIDAMENKIGSSFFAIAMIARILYGLGCTEHFEQRYVSVADNKEEEILGRIIALMENGSSKADREDIAQELHYNADYLNRIVKKYTGKTLGELSRFLSVAKARERILSETTPISQIVQEMGFSNRTFFYKLFKSQYGTTPNECRENRK